MWEEGPTNKQTNTHKGLASSFFYGSVMDGRTDRSVLLFTAVSQEVIDRVVPVLYG